MYRHALNEFFGHFVWGTWDRLPLLVPGVREPVYAAIRAKCEELRCSVWALGGVEDHVHLVVELAGPVSQSLLAKEVKGASSHLITHDIRSGEFFKWQGAYASFSLNRNALPDVTAYVERQEEHHRRGTLDAFWELPTASEFGG